MRKLLILVVVLTLGLFLVSCGGSTPPTTTPPATTPPVTTPPPTPEIDAQKLYNANCAACHGQNRQGTPNLAPALNAATIGDDSDAEIKNTITKGKADTAMAGFEGRLSSAEIDALVQFVKKPAP